MKKILRAFSRSVFALIFLSTVPSEFAQAIHSSAEPGHIDSSFEKSPGEKERGFSGSRSTRLAGDPQSANNSTIVTPPDERALAAQEHYENGLRLQASGKYREAIGAFKSVIKLVRDHARAHYSLGMVYDSLKDYGKAADSFKLAVRFEPDWPEAHFRYGVASYVLGRMNVAMEEYKKLAKVNSPYARLLERILRVENSNFRPEPNSGAPSAVGHIDTASDSKSKKPSSEIAQPSIGPSSSQSSKQEVADTEVSSPDTQPATESSRSLSKPVQSVNTELSAPVRQPDNATATTRSVTPNPQPPALAPSIIQPPKDTELTSIYKVGRGDVLDIRLPNTGNGRSTLFTVANTGMIDLPFAGGPIAVAGLTTEEIQNRIAAELERLALHQQVSVTVGVRLYASHEVIVTGLIHNPGAKFLRREAVPLYVVMAEAQPRPDAGRISILRDSGSQSLDLSDPTALNFIVKSGDVINVSARLQEYYYIGGRIKYPGQKIFQTGITVLQAILAAGGIDHQDYNKIDLSREAADGRLITFTYSLKDIKAGKIPDPKLRPGDRVEVVK